MWLIEQLSTESNISQSTVDNITGRLRGGKQRASTHSNEQEPRASCKTTDRLFKQSLCDGIEQAFKKAG